MTDEVFVLLSLAMLCLFSTTLAVQRGFFVPLSSVKASIQNSSSNVKLGDLLQLFMCYFVLQVAVVPAVAYFWLSFNAGEWLKPPIILKPEERVWINSVGMILGATALWFYSRWLLPKAFKTAMGAKSKLQPLRDFLFGSMSWLICYPVVLFLGQLLGLAIEELFHPAPVDQLAVKNVKIATGNPMLFALTFVATVTVVPAVEELLFRGFLQNWLRRHFSFSGAIVITSLIFAAFHFSTKQGVLNIELLPSLFLLSCFLGYLYERQSSLWASIGLHATFNFISALAIALKESIAVSANL